MIDERTELLMTRRLDGELTEADALELNKFLIRSPEARRLMEAYEADAAAASDALSVYCQPASSYSTNVHVRSVRWFEQLGRGWRAVAASLILATMVGLSSHWPARNDQTQSMIAGQPELVVAGTPQQDSTPAVEGPREEMHQLHRNVFGVWDDETNSLYVLELDQRAEKVVAVSQNF